MFRSLLRPVVGLVILSVTTPAFAADKSEPTAPSTAVAAAWAKEAELQGPSSAGMTTLLASYGALQTLDMVSTIKARQLGASEVNPIMGGGFGQASMTKALLAAGTIVAVKGIEKKSRKAAFLTMVALNVATAAIVANNYRNVRQLNQR